MHVAAIYNRTAITALLLTCPQGGPEQLDIYAQEMRRAWFSFLCCVHRLKNNNTISFPVPKDVTHIIFSHMLPKPQHYINHVPLRNLLTFAPFMCPAYKAALVTALYKRHMNKLRYVLQKKFQINKQLTLTPLEVAHARIAQGRGHPIMVKLLNPRQLKNFDNEIREGYKKLFK